MIRAQYSLLLEDDESESIPEGLVAPVIILEHKTKYELIMSILLDLEKKFSIMRCDGLPSMDYTKMALNNIEQFKAAIKSGRI